MQHIKNMQTNSHSRVNCNTNVKKDTAKYDILFSIPLAMMKKLSYFLDMKGYTLPALSPEICIILR